MHIPVELKKMNMDLYQKKYQKNRSVMCLLPKKKRNIAFAYKKK